MSSTVLGELELVAVARAITRAIEAVAGEV
jgi:hypothetical protein